MHYARDKMTFQVNTGNHVRELLDYSCYMRVRGNVLQSGKSSPGEPGDNFLELMLNPNFRKLFTSQSEICFVARCSFIPRWWQPEALHRQPCSIVNTRYLKGGIQLC